MVYEAGHCLSQSHLVSNSLQVRSAQQTAACRAASPAEAAALTNFSTLVDFQMSLPALEEAEPAVVPAGCGAAAAAAAAAALLSAVPMMDAASPAEPASPAVIRADIFDAQLPALLDGGCHLAPSELSPPQVRRGRDFLAT